MPFEQRLQGREGGSNLIFPLPTNRGPLLLLPTCSHTNLSHGSQRLYRIRGGARGRALLPFVLCHSIVWFGEGEVGDALMFPCCYTG